MTEVLSEAASLMSSDPALSYLCCVGVIADMYFLIIHAQGIVLLLLWQYLLLAAVIHLEIWYTLIKRARTIPNLSELCFNSPADG